MIAKANFQQIVPYSNSMTKYGLRTWMILLTLAPTLLIGLLLGSYFTVSRFQQLDESLIDQGINLIEPLAIAAEYGLRNNSREELMRLISISQRKHTPVVRSINVFTANSNIFVSSNFHRQFEQLKLPSNQPIPNHTTVRQEDDFIILHSPVYPDLSQRQELNPDPIGYVAIQMDRTSAKLFQHQTAFHTFLILLAGAVLSLIFTFRLVHKVIRPILDMVQAIDEIRRGQLKTQLEGEHIGELEDLKNGINTMAKSIGEHQSEMQQNIDQATQELRETLEQIEIQNVEMDLSKRRAQEAARIKSEFLANMSHELRTPLNGVLGFSKQLLKTQLSGPQRDQVETIESSAKNLLSIINDILDLSKLEAGKLTLDQTPFILQDSIDEVMLLLAPGAYQKSLDLSVRIDPKVPNDLLGDDGRIKQVLTNLVSNAIKFTDRGSIQIRISLGTIEVDQAIITMEVEDTGVGIAPQQQKSLFQAFAQADSSISRRFGGTGLGLVITKHLLQQMEGDIRLESSPGEGSTFTCFFKCRISPIALTETVKADQILRQSALLYEPQQYALENLEETMHDWLMQLTPCQTKRQWQQFTRSGTSYDVVLMNIDGMDVQQLGYELSRLSQLTTHTILMTAFVNRPELEQLQQIQGMKVSYLRKPVATPRLLDALKELNAESISPAIPAQTKPTPIEPTKERLGLTVLAVDDNPANLKLITTLLKEKVRYVENASGGQQAIDLAQQHTFDIIFMDIQMPNIDGVMATEQIRKDGKNRNTPVVAVTAHALPEERANLLASGMDDYLTKPIDEELLDRILSHWHSYSDEPQVSSVQNHPLVDWQQALEQAGGRTELAREMLELFIQSLPESKTAIDSAWNSQNIAELKAQVHRLHGACCYAGVPQLKSASEMLEKLLKQGHGLNDVEPEYLELGDLLEQLLEVSPQAV